MQQLKVNQWLNPLVSGAIIVLGAWHEEQQRTSQVVPGRDQGRRRPARGPAAGPRRDRRRRARLPPVEVAQPQHERCDGLPDHDGHDDAHHDGTTGTTGTTTTASAGTSADGTSAAPLGTTGPTSTT
jgi:hypothetical protein